MLLDMYYKTNYSQKGKDFILELWTLILTCNYFMFEDNFYLQCRGIAMVVNVAPTFANIFVASMEEDSIYISHHFYNVLKWWRYIDDVFLMWAGNSGELEEFH